MAFPEKYCLICEHGHTHETSHEWIETHCDIKNKWMSPYHDACENFKPNPKYYKEDTTDERKSETD